jgi:HAMP domain-containing protein
VAATQPGPRVELTRRRRRGLVVALVLGLAAVLLFVVAFAAVAMLGIRSDLQRGQRALEDARRALVNGNLDQAVTAFDEAEGAFAAGQRRSRGLPARAGSWLPFAGNNVDVGAGLAEAGTHVASAGRLLTDALATLPEGLGSLAPQAGRIPVDDIAGLAAPVRDATDRAAAAVAAVEATPESFLVAPVAEARWDALDEIGEAADALEAADGLLAQLPAFAGAERPKRYLIASENPAELRGTGGIWGAYAALTLDDGDPAFSKVRSIQELGDIDATDLASPSPDYERNYGEFGAVGSWQNLNMTPDFPTAARAALGAFEATTGDRFDGMIVADPFALELMLRVTGPAPIPGTDLRLAADDVVAFTTNEAYSIFDRAIIRKEVLGTVAIDVFERFLALEGKGMARIRALALAASGGHLKLYSRDEGFQGALADAGADGAHAMPSEGDLLGIHLNDATGAKIDFYATRRIDHTVRLGGKGEAIATTTLTLGNEAPTRGEPRYVVGPFAEGLSEGDNRALATLSCHEPCTMVESLADGEAVALATGSEGGVPWFRDFGTIPPGGTRTLGFTTRTEGVWDGNGSGGSYRITVLGQTTIRPTELRLRIEPPAGTEIVWTSEEMAVEDGAATWTGDAPSQLDLEVRFRAPLPLRWWRNVLRPFGGL